MKNKQDYINQNEIRVKQLLSDMYDNESNLLSKIEKRKKQEKKIKDEIKELQKDYKKQKKLRIDLNNKFNTLKESKSSKWEDFKSEYEMVLDFAEGDKFSFISKAEEFLEELNVSIEKMEEKVKNSTESTKKKSQALLEEMNDRKEGLQKRLDEARKDSGELWKEVKQWYIEKAADIRALFTSDA